MEIFILALVEVISMEGVMDKALVTMGIGIIVVVSSEAIEPVEATITTDVEEAKVVVGSRRPTMSMRETLSRMWFSRRCSIRPALERLFSRVVL
jgi:hypothetical protein